LVAWVGVASWSVEARAQDATGQTFTLENFRPAVDSKGYITVNASQILGHLDFSLGLVGSWAHQVMNLKGPRDPATGYQAQFGINELITPQLQAAVGFFKWVELGLSLPVHIMFGSRANSNGKGFVDPGNPNFNNDLTFSGQYIGDVGIHLKARFLNTSKYPVGLAFLASVYRSAASPAACPVTSGYHRSDDAARLRSGSCRRC
jgi:hypothetical protein